MKIWIRFGFSVLLLGLFAVGHQNLMPHFSLLFHSFKRSNFKQFTKPWRPVAVHLRFSSIMTVLRKKKKKKRARIFGFCLPSFFKKKEKKKKSNWWFVCLFVVWLFSNFVFIFASIFTQRNYGHRAWCCGCGLWHALGQRHQRRGCKCLHMRSLLLIQNLSCWFFHLCYIRFRSAKNLLMPA